MGSMSIYTHTVSSHKPCCLILSFPPSPPSPGHYFPCAMPPPLPWSSPQVRLGAVTPSSHALHAAIKALTPRTLSWSNVPDYFHPRDFHAMARACSADADTVHHSHSMNWVMVGLGAWVHGYKGTCFWFSIVESYLRAGNVIQPYNVI